MQHAGEYLARNFGASYKYIWGLGLLAAGQASTMSGTYTGKHNNVTSIKIKVCHLTTTWVLTGLVQEGLLLSTPTDVGKSHKQ